MDKILLGDLCLPASKNIKLASTDLIDYVDISSVDNQAKFITGYTTYEYQDAPSRARKSVSIGDVIISTVRPNLNAVAVFDITTPNTPVVSTGFCVLSCRDDVNPRYVYYACQSREFIRQLVSQATGASYPAVNDKIIRNALIPNYTLSSQNFICDQLDSVQNLINIKKKENKIFNETIKARFVEMFENAGYPTERLGSICSKITDGTHKTPQYLSEGITFISAKNIVNGKLNFTDIKHISEEEYTEIQNRCQTEKGDILLSKSGSLGTPVIVETTERLGLFESLAVIKYDRNRILPEFLCEQLKLDKVQRQFKSGTKGVAVKHLHLGVISDTEISVPPLEVQRTFAIFVAQVDKSKSVNDRIIDRLQRTKASLMQEYFG